MTSGPRRPGPDRRTVRPEVEPLEARDVPSASLLGLALQANPAAVSVGLDIVGTGITSDARGLPASLSGDIYLGPHQLGLLVGRYHESLTPLLFNGLFIGTTGEATFTFTPGAQAGPPVETIRTKDTSFIQGIDPGSGGLIVASLGLVSESAGMLPSVGGGFSSASLVVLGQRFALQTHVDFQATVG